MLKQTFTSQPFTYRLPADIPVTFFPGASYNAYLTTAPRIYGEEYAGGAAAMFVNDETFIDGYEAIYLLANYNQVHWPGYLSRLQRWNGTSGDYLGGIDSSSSAGFIQYAQDRDGTIWGCYTTTTLHALKYSIDSTSHDLTTDSVVVYNFTGFAGLIELSAFNIDLEQNLLIGVATDSYLRVWNLTTGALIRSIPLPDVGVNVMLEDTSRCYVMCTHGQLCLINYSTGKVLSAFRVQATAPNAIAFDQKYRRLLAWNYTAITTEGQNTSVIGGYFPLQQAVGLTAPIPIRPPRKFRTTPIYTRLYGDMGESVGGSRVTLSVASGPATVTGFPALTDGDGEAIGSITDTDAGSLNLNASVTVP